MKSRILCTVAVLLLLILLPTGALALTGQSISVFETYYKDDIVYINENTGRHLLPKDLAQLDLKDHRRTQYYYYDDALHVTLATDENGIIESCEIRLMIPEGTVYGNSLYRDFETAGYHSYALIMAMHVSSEPSSRYLLVQEISAALEDNFGFYERQLGSYTINCTRVVGEGAVFTFSNNGVKSPSSGESTNETPDTQVEPPAVIDIEDDEGANLG